VDLDKLRQGVKFQNKAPVNGRELTADDVVFNFKRAVASPNSTWYNSKTTITKIDKYTVRFDLAAPNLEPMTIGFTDLVIGAPEIAQQYGDMTNWKTIVGTGPFTVTDVVTDSSITYTRNPDYWAHDPLLPQNQLPYLDRLVALVIIDPATQDAALRTGKTDRLGLTKQRTDAMLKTTPYLKQRPYANPSSNVLSVRLDLKDKPYADVRVRQALMMAIDNKAIADSYYEGDATIMQWPFQPAMGSVYTPLEQLPPNDRQLYEYHPDLAKQLLAQAGYPNGFNITITLLTGTYAGGVDLYSIVKDNWDAVGVKTTLQVLEAGAFWSVVLGRTYQDTVATNWGYGTLINAMQAYDPTYPYNYSKVNDPHITQVWTDAQKMTDITARNKVLKDLGVYMIDQVYWLNLPTPQVHMLWQPWVKGYNGEVSFGTANGWYGMYRFIWIDQKLRNASPH